MNQNKSAYIAGKVTGIPAHLCTAKFGQKQKELEQQGYKVINPLAVVADAVEHSEQWLKMPWQTAMRHCIAAMMQAEEIHLLHDWSESRGAIIEHAIAGMLGIKIVYPR